MSKANTTKENTTKDNSETTESPKNKSGFFAFIKSIINFFGSEKFHKTIGVFFLLVFPLFLFFSFVSFYASWKNDFNYLELSVNELFGNTNINVDNWLGKLGALTAYQFIYKGFGLTSFAFIFLSFIIGFRILFKSSILPIFKSFKISLFIIVWGSILFGYFAEINNSNFRILGGVFGYESSVWLNSSLGNSGTGLLLFFTLMAFIIFRFNISFENLFQSKKEPEFEIEEPEMGNNIINEKIPITEELVNNIEEEDEEIADSEIIEEFAKEEDDQFELIINNSNESAVENFHENTEENTDDDFEVNILNDEETPIDSEEAERLITLEPYDPTLELSNYKFPTLDLLEEYKEEESQTANVNMEELEENKNVILTTLNNYNIQISKIKATVGPTVTLYEIIPAPGVRISKIKNLEDDIALSLAALGIRIIAPMPGKGTIGIEVPNKNPKVVSMHSVLSSEAFLTSKFQLPIALGRTISNEVFITDLAKMPHLLMAGATGQGKSVGLNAILASLLYKKHPSQLKFVLVDPKKVELSLFNKIERHFLAKLPDSQDAIITDTQKVVSTLNSLCIEMDQRYDLLKDAHVRDIKEYNAKFIKRRLNPNNGHRYLPYIVLVVDEFADLIMTAGKEVEMPIARLAQLARAIGIHLIIATQRPSVNIITGTIKANFPARVAFRVTAKVDSRTILDTGGAEQLIGRGDMLLSNGSSVVRIQCAFIDTPEVENITDFIGSQMGYPEAFILPEVPNSENENSGGGSFDNNDKDPMFDDAARLIVEHQQGSTSLIQRRLKLGYNRAGRIIDQLENAGIVGPFEGSKARQVLVNDLLSLEQLLKSLSN